jgi:hypothetical protein
MSERGIQQAVQILNCQHGKIVAVPEGMTILRSLGRIDAVVSVTGPVRTGKSSCCVFLSVLITPFTPCRSVQFSFQSRWGFSCVQCRIRLHQRDLDGT